MAMKRLSKNKQNRIIFLINFWKIILWVLFSEDTRKIQAENKDKINKKELERMQREKTAQNGNVFARQHEEMDKQLDKEVGYFIFVGKNIILPGY